MIYPRVHRMYRTGDWSAADLVKYLATIRKELTAEEMARLGQTRAFVAELPPSSQANTPISPKAASGIPNTSAANTTKYIASELFEPTDANRTLGLPILAWSHSKWRSNSPEGTFDQTFTLVHHTEFTLQPLFSSRLVFRNTLTSKHLSSWLPP
jgi:hypothetical protein